jgi:hypothetical protein
MECAPFEPAPSSSLLSLESSIEQSTKQVHPCILYVPSHLPAYQEIGVLDQAEQDLIFANIKGSNSPLVWVRDPSGNLIEIQGQEGFGLIS